MKRMARNIIGQSAAKRRCGEKDSKPATPSNSTALLDLNDDCFFEVFRYLDLVDLGSVADVCSRLKSTTQEYFGISSYRDMYLPRDISAMDKRPPFKKRLQQMCRVMRNFGSKVRRLEESNHATFEFFKRVRKTERSKYRRILFKLVVDYCGAELEELHLTHFDANDVDIENMPQLSLVHHVTLNASQISDALWEQLPRWCPKMLRLELFSERMNGEKVKPYNVTGIRRPFPALRMATFQEENTAIFADIVELLKLNPKLDHLGVNNCKHLDIRLLAAIDEYLPRLLSFEFLSQKVVAKKHVAIVPNCIEKMSNLMHLQLMFPDWRGSYHFAAI